VSTEPTTTEIAPEPDQAVALSPSPAAAGSVVGRVLPKAILAMALLVASGVIRYQMESAVAANIDATRFSPFKLAEIPLELGPWSGKDEKLDPFIARMTGSTDYIMRRYTNSQTGAILELLMLYGPAADMGYHKPDACYPGAGYKLIGGGDQRPVQFKQQQNDRAVNLKHLVFQRGEGGLADRQQVYYTWRYSDTYAVEIGQPSAFGRLPGMFKIQVARSLAPTESPDGRANAANPCEDFLTRLMPIFEGKLIAPAGSTTTSKPPAAPDAAPAKT
jgi:hypothetical protein